MDSFFFLSSKSGSRKHDVRLENRQKGNAVEVQGDMVFSSEQILKRRTSGGIFAVLAATKHEMISPSMRLASLTRGESRR